MPTNKSKGVIIKVNRRSKEVIESQLKVLSKSGQDGSKYFRHLKHRLSHLN